ncbi:hypothetical protein SRABI84_04523 [Peribacillus simplex]|nr:hypothetical protein [Peribacillus simplex]CAH0301221.1 hypothetical protein SRABI84_04523 [Peribacillus simplex]
MITQLNQEVIQALTDVQNGKMRRMGKEALTRLEEMIEEVKA